MLMPRAFGPQVVIGLLGVVAALLTFNACDRAPSPPDTAHRSLLATFVASQHERTERCTVGDDSRESLVLAPDQEMALTVSVPAAARLRYALAAADGTPGGMLQLRVDDDVLGEPAPTTPDRWTAYEVDLSRFAGHTIVLRAKATSGGACWAHPVVAARGYAGPLVVVVLLDTVRADRLAVYGHTRPNTPNLDALATDGIVFDDATSDASWTRASVATLFTGQSALTHGVLSRDAHLEPRWPTLAERLRAGGFTTIAFSTNPNVLPFWGFARGFDRFVDVGAESWIHNSDAAVVVDAALATIDASGTEPMLLYLHLNDAHAPYDPPPFEATALLGHYDPASPGRVLTPRASAAEVQGALDRYDAEIAYLDAQLGRFFTDVRRRGRYDEAMIVVVGDHGEEFLEHGGVYHGHTLFREVLDIPLLIKLPGNRGAGTRVATGATMQDVLPTVLAAIDLPRDALSGRMLVTKAGQPVEGSSFPRFAVTDMDHVTAYGVENDAFTLIMQTRPKPGTWVFDRRSDPHQRTNVAATTAPQIVTPLHQLLDERLLAARAGWHVRACGGTGPSVATIRLASSTPLARMERIDLEQDDAVAVASESALTWTSSLPQQTRIEERFGKLLPVTKPDRDELVFGNAGPLTVGYEGGATIFVGGSARPVPGGTATISVTDAHAPAVFAPSCPPEPSLLVWHMGSPSAAPAADPDLERRLRAIGYLQ